MTVLEEMKSWVGFDAADEARLRALAPHAEAHLEVLTDDFYARVLAHPGAARVLDDPAQVERLKVTLRAWAHELLSGPWDEGYSERRQRIGRVHVRIGLEARYMFTAMNVFRTGLCGLAHAYAERDDADATCHAIGRITDIDLALMTGTFVERREERQLQTLQELVVSHLPVTVIVLDAELRVAAATRTFGGDVARGTPYADALPADLVRSAELDRQVRHAVTSRREITLTRVDADIEGEGRSFRISVVPLEHPTARVLLHVEELTDAIRSEARLQRAESLAQLGALSAAVAHELRNPLAGISGAIQVIAGTLPPDDRRRPIMEKVEQQVRRLDLLVTELLDFARPTDARLSTVDLFDAARLAVEFVQREHGGVRFEVRGRGMAWADANLVHQIVLNLLLNAVQAVEGAGEVSVDVEVGRVLVSDTGPGVPAENVERIFTPFFTTRTRGTGLGLAICRKLAGAMNGTLDLVDSRAGGASFALELPQEE